jgi:hypothetical protein
MGICLFSKAVLSNGWVYFPIKNLLPSNECCFFVSESIPNNGCTRYNVLSNLVHQSNICSMSQDGRVIVPFILCAWLHSYVWFGKGRSHRVQNKYARPLSDLFTILVVSSQVLNYLISTSDKFLVNKVLLLLYFYASYIRIKTLFSLNKVLWHVMEAGNA